jgi:hypothetical protein
MMFRNTLRRGLTITLLGLALATPLSQAADPVSLTLYNGQHKEVGDASPKPSKPRPAFTSMCAKAAAISSPARSSKKVIAPPPT